MRVTSSWFSSKSQAPKIRPDGNRAIDQNLFLQPNLESLPLPALNYRPNERKKKNKTKKVNQAEEGVLDNYAKMTM